MLATGTCNLLAILLIGKALQLTTVVRVNVINDAVATALTVIVGIVIFAEPSSPRLIIGIVLTLVNVVLIGYNEQLEDEPEATAAAAVETRE
ncbi:MAG: hypothetical protein NTW96_02620 [Planctomycetia bacterium]|nr:hypothetical protein [Planctomycetia bacterium]